METALTNFVFDRVMRAIGQTTYLGELVLTRTTRLAEDLQLGKFGLLKLALYLEEIFDIELSDEALSRFATVGDVAAHLSRNYFRDADICALAEAA